MKIYEKTEQTEATKKELKKSRFRGEKIPCLIMVEGNYIGEIYPIDKSVMILGRDNDADIVIGDLSVSRKHAKIEKEQDLYILYDLGSTNGIIHNGERKSQAALNDGDKIELGRVVMRFGYQDSLDKDYHEKLRSMAIRDGLTKIYNKRYFEDALRREFSYASRNDIDLSLVLFDIDDFKKINDTFGHTVGDVVLQTIAELLEREIRGYDVFARYGGEEFVFLLRGISPDNTLNFAERIRSIVEANTFIINDQKVKVTISVGYAVMNPHVKFKSPQDFEKQADRYLYKAKSEGKNRVCYPDEALDETTQPTRKKP